MDSDRLNQAINLTKLGEKREARRILEDLVWQEPHNIQAWLWLAETMPSAREQREILLEGYRQNPGNPILERSTMALEPDEALSSSIPPAPETPNAASNSINQVFDHDSEEINPLPENLAGPSDSPKNEVDWLQSLRSSASKSEVPLNDDTYPPGGQNDTGVIPFDPDPVQSDEQDVADWLASLNAAQAEDSPAVDGIFKTPIPQQENVKNEHFRSQSSQELPGRKSGDMTNSPQWLQPLKRDAQPEPAPVEAMEYEIEEPPPSRRWLVVFLVVLALGVLAATAVLMWPTIKDTVTQIFEPLAKEPLVGGVPDTPTPSITPSPTPTRTATPTPTVTPLPSHTPTVTATPTPIIAKAEIVSPENLQQFRVLASVHAKGAIALEARLLAEVADAQTVRIWDFLSQQPLIDLKGSKANIQQAAISPDGNLAAAASEEPAVWVWNIQTGRVVATYAFSADLVSQYAGDNFSRTLQVQFSPDSKAVFATSLLGVTWWDLQTGQERHLFPLLVNELKTFREQAAAPSGKNATSFLISFSPDGKSLAVGSPFKVYILSWPGAGGKATLISGKPLVEMRWMQNGLLGLFHPGQVVVWDTILNKPVQTFSNFKAQAANLPANVALRLDGKWAAVEVENNRGLPGGLKIVELASGRTLLTVDPHTDSPVENPCFSPDGRLLFGGSGGDLFVWNASTGRELRRIANRRGFSQVSADGKIYVELSPSDTSLWGVAIVP